MHRFTTDTETCAEAEIVIGLWRLPVACIHGEDIEIPIYVTSGDGVLLVGNNVLSDSNIIGMQNALVIPPQIPGLTNKGTVVLRTYSTSGLRTHLLVVPCHTASFRSYFGTASPAASSSVAPSLRGIQDFSTPEHARKFALKLHALTHMRLPDMETVCSRAGVLYPALRKELISAIESCTICKTTRNPVRSNKVSFGKTLANFNSYLQLDFFYIAEFGKANILHIVDVASSFSATCLAPPRDMDNVSELIERIWIHMHGPPSMVSADPEFDNDAIKTMLFKNSCRFEPQPAR